MQILVNLPLTTFNEFMSILIGVPSVDATDKWKLSPLNTTFRSIMRTHTVVRSILAAEEIKFEDQVRTIK